MAQEGGDVPQTALCRIAPGLLSARERDTVLLSQMTDDGRGPSGVVVFLHPFRLEAGLAVPPFRAVGIEPSSRSTLAFFFSTVLPDGRRRFAAHANGG